MHFNIDLDKNESLNNGNYCVLLNKCEILFSLVKDFFKQKINFL
jgi:hypothetical protein